MFPFFAKSKTTSSRKTPTKPNQAPVSSPSPTKKSSKSSSSTNRLPLRPTGKLQSKHRSSRKASSVDLSDTHPLNLPPEERERRRSAIATMTDTRTDEMDIDHEGSAAAEPSSPSAPGAFPDSQGGGGGGGSGSGDPMEDDDNTDIMNGTSSPVPPPHMPQPVQETKPIVDPEACKAAGNKFFKLRDWSKAIQEYGKAIDAAPLNPTYLSNRSAAYMSANRFLDALEDAKRADELEPGNSKVLLRLARIYTALGRPSEALEVYDRIQPPVTAKDKGPAASMQTYIHQAESALKGTTGSMALHALDQAERGLGVGVDKPRKWKLLRGEAYLKMGNVNALGDAQNVAMSMLRSNQQDPEALVLRGRALYAQGDNEKAIGHFRKALECDPDFKLAVSNLRMVQKLDKLKEKGNAAYKAGRMQEAADIYGEALAVDPGNKGTNSKLLQNRALASIKLKKYDSAIEDCTRALALDPSYLKARKTKARALGEAGNWEESAREWKSIAESNPQEPGIGKDVRNAELELKKSKRKDYYKILNLEKDCDESQIKKAYRKLAIVHHPDKNPDDVDAEDKFKEIGEAYETLSDPEKRARYDSGEDLIDPSEMFGHGGGQGFGGMGGGGVQIDPEMLFNMMGGMGGHGGGGGQTYSFSSGGGGGGGNPFGGGSRRGGGFGF